MFGSPEKTRVAVLYRDIGGKKMRCGIFRNEADARTFAGSAAMGKLEYKIEWESLRVIFVLVSNEEHMSSAYRAFTSYEKAQKNINMRYEDEIEIWELE